jgi:hypothetical protein
MRVFCTLFASALIVATVATACSSAPVPLAVPDGCDPLVPEHCGFPFPNDLWRDASGHIAFGPNTLPVPSLGAAIDPNKLNWRDGFSPGECAMTFLADAQATGLPDENHLADSILTTSPTILMEADTGALVPHLAEIDMGTFHDDDRALMMHPVVRLKDGTRYIAAVRNVVDSNGLVIAPSAAFEALRDSEITEDQAVESRRAHYEDIFAKLTAAGIDRKTLQIAWDYTTATQQNTTSDLLGMRDDALATVGAQGPSFTITQIENAPNQYLSKRLHGMMTVPLYLSRPDAGDDEHIVRDANGKPMQNGTAQYEFVVLIPPSATAANPAPILQNGHGLLGSLDEGTDGYFAQMCGQYNYIGVAVDWVGMAADDNQTLVDAITQDVTIFQNVVDRQHQGFVNALLAMRMMMGGLASDPNLQDGGQSIIDTTKHFYRGDSQGGIFGTTYMSISTDVSRGYLGEPGMPYEFLLDRSEDFSGFKLLLRGSFPNGLDGRLIQAFLQLEWDRTEPDGYAEMLAASHRVIIADALGDHQVTPLGAHVIARTIGAVDLNPLNRELFGIPGADGPLTSGSAVIEYDFGLAPAPTTNIPATDGTDPHGEVRTLKPAMDQADEFFRNGDIKAFCDGPCDPT